MIKSYVEKINILKSFQLKEKMWNLNPKVYYNLKLKNTNFKPLNDFVIKEKIGKEIGSENYVNINKFRFLKTENISNNFCIDDSNVEFCIPEHNIKPEYNNILIAKDGNGDGLGEVVLYNLENNNNDFLSSGIFCLTIKNEKLFYILAFLKSKFFKTFIDISTPEASTLRHSKKISLKYPIPFPTKENNCKPEDVEKLISLITQNIIDKEEQIKFKNRNINNLIEKELNNNQKDNIFQYKYPTRDEVFQEGRLDTGLYTKEYKKIKFLIENYKNGNFELLQKYHYSRGQNLQVSQIGSSIYSNIYRKNFYRLLTNTEISDNQTIVNFRYLGNKNNLTLLPLNCILLTADGTVGRSIFIDHLQNTITNIHPWILTKKINNNENIFENIFVSCFLHWLREKTFYEKIKDKANGGGIKLNHLEKYIKIPNFSDLKQKRIAKEYYNIIDKNNNINLENYLDLEKKRNLNLGIFQLNMEIFDLKNKLEELIDKIITNGPIDIIKYF